MITINEIITIAYNSGASDLHIAVNSPPVCRIYGRLLPFDAPDWPGDRPVPSDAAKVFTAADTCQLARELMTEEQYGQFMAAGEYDFSYSAGICRCRVNVFKQQGRIGAVLRLLKNDVPILAELGLPDVLASLCGKLRGLVLVTGTAGSGKSTTLAAMINLINEKSRRHVITLEDPVEYVHEHKNSLISQREVGRDTSSFANALRAALREDPDVILIGEMRDAETISIALTAAETGNLVFGTLHTAGAAQAIDRIVNAFPPYQQQQIRAQLGNTILAVTSQVLLPRSDQSGRTPVVEVMIATLAIRNLIREGKTFQIINQMQTGVKYGMQTLDTALQQIYRQGTISKEVVLDYAVDPESILQML